MFKDTILWVSDTLQTGVASRLERAGYAVLLARVREALAVLFVNRSIDAVVVNAGDSRASDILMLVRGLRAIRDDTAIFVVTNDEEAARTVSSVDGCIAVGDDLDRFLPQLRAAMLKPAV
jgi:DNA-binding response OmpR family regulator